jgi:hypothetical protein
MGAIPLQKVTAQLPSLSLFSGEDNEIKKIPKANQRILFQKAAEGFFPNNPRAQELHVKFKMGECTSEEIKELRSYIQENESFLLDKIAWDLATALANKK